MNTELVVTMFEGEDAASNAYQALQQLEQDGDIAILDAATIVKHGDGTSAIKDTQDVDTRHGAFFGVISGALIGLLGGPAGAMIGAVAGGIMGAMSDAARKQEAAQLNGNSAAVAQAERARLETQASDYRRAISACLEGRGYTVK